MNNSLTFYLNYALRSLRRGGQHTLLAVACVAFGVFTLIVMQVLAANVNQSLQPDPRQILGGDALMRWIGADIRLSGPASSDLPMAQIGPQQVAQLEQLRQQGTISAYTLSDQNTRTLLRVEGSNQSYIAGRSMAVDPGTYPLVNGLQIEGVDGDVHAALTQALKAPGSVAITRDLADSLHLKIGTRMLMGGMAGLLPFQVHVTAILTTLPDQKGDTIVYSLDTDRQMYGFQEVANTVQVMWGQTANPVKLLAAAGWDLRIPSDVVSANASSTIIQVFYQLLQAAGILGLLIGGIGVANTIQVLLAKRTLEIAVLKTYGYRKRDLLLLFGLETGILGLAGSLLGSAAAIGTASPLVTLLQRFTNGAATIYYDPWSIAGGIAAGIAITLVFGLSMIVRASEVRPVTLLRNLSVHKGFQKRLGETLLYVMLAVVLVLVSSLVMKSLLLGIDVIVAAAAGLALMSGLFGSISYLIVRIPIPGHSLLSLARNNLKRQWNRVIFVLIALFAGVFAISIGTTATASAVDRAAERQIPSGRPDVWVFGSPAQSSTVHSFLAAQSITDIQQVNQSVVQIRRENGLVITTSIEGRFSADVGDLIQLVDNTQWDPSADAIYLPVGFQSSPWNYQRGMQITVIDKNGSQSDLRVAGFYKSNFNAIQVLTPQGLLVNKKTLYRWNPALLSTISSGLLSSGGDSKLSALSSQVLPDMLVISKMDEKTYLQRFYWALVGFVVAVSGLALLAGGILIANTVGLAVIERSRELGILKAVGYSRQHVLITLLLENSLLGLIAGLLGVGASGVAVYVVNGWLPALRMTFNPILTPLMGFCAILLAMLSTLLAAWKPVHIRPMSVLREE